MPILDLLNWNFTRVDRSARILMDVLEECHFIATYAAHIIMNVVAHSDITQCKHLFLSHGLTCFSRFWLFDSFIFITLFVNVTIFLGHLTNLVFKAKERH